MPKRVLKKIHHLHPTVRTAGFFLLKILVAVLVILLLIRKISLERLVHALVDANAAYITAGVMLLVFNIFLQYKKWQLIVFREAPFVKRRHVLYSLLVGSALGLVTPGRLGDFGRTFFIKNVNWAKLLGLLMVDKLITLAVLYFFGIIGLSHFISMRMHPFVWLPIFIMTIVLVLFFLLFLLRPELLRSIVSRYHSVFSRYSSLDKIISGVEMATPHFTLQLLALTALQTLTYCSQFLLFLFAFIEMPILAAYLSIFAIMFAKSLLPISLGDLGIRESAAVYFLGYFGVPDVAAFNASFLLFLINILLPSIVGLGLLLFKRQNTLLSNGKNQPD
ncbi:UPF0104 family protein [candidate division KSB1 bacterium]|nr:flippase-like domain-containing protein [candidate division KSB1 bacterium]RQW00989.1 MAG: UPF0104 family protein [candidate division KSB1 bacterium]